MPTPAGLTRALSISPGAAPVFTIENDWKPRLTMNKGIFTNAAGNGLSSFTVADGVAYAGLKANVILRTLSPS